MYEKGEKTKQTRTRGLLHGLDAGDVGDVGIEIEPGEVELGGALEDCGIDVPALGLHACVSKRW